MVFMVACLRLFVGVFIMAFIKINHRGAELARPETIYLRGYFEEELIYIRHCCTRLYAIRVFLRRW